MTGPDRPSIHFTPRRGWVNDPHAVTYAGGRYHLFFQHNPDGPQWAPGVHWGHATSPDLLRWREEPIAFSPADDETGCWTGALTSGPDGPVILYTSVVGDEEQWNRGRVAMAQGSPSMREWRRVAEPVIAGPPDGAGVTVFRDPCVWRHGGGWTMILGASMHGRGAALQYTSTNLRDWTYDGVVADGGAVEPLAAHSSDPPPPATMWECPQLFPLDGAWVLLVSLWAQGVLLDVAAAVGDYDGRRFTPRSWQRFTYGELLYATTTFLDEGGRRCAFSWLREDPSRPAPDGPFAGAISLPYVLVRDGQRVVPTFHPLLDGVRRPVTGHLPSPHAQLIVDHDGELTLRLEQAPDAVLTIEITGDRVRVRDGPARLRIDAPLPGGRAKDRAQRGRLDVVVDGGIVELVVAGAPAMMATRWVPRADRPLRWSVTGPTPEVTPSVRAYTLDAGTTPP